MTVTQLRQKYLEVFGEESRSNHKQFLFRRIAWRIQALAEGGLSERARRRALEIANDADLRIRAPKTDPGRTPGIPKVPEKLGRSIPGCPRREPTWNASTAAIIVKVLVDGFEFDGEIYPVPQRHGRNEATGDQVERLPLLQPVGCGGPNGKE